MVGSELDAKHPGTLLKSDVKSPNVLLALLQERSPGMYSDVYANADLLSIIPQKISF